VSGPEVSSPLQGLGWGTLIEGEMISRKAAMMEITIMSSRTVWVGVKRLVLTDLSKDGDIGADHRRPERHKAWRISRL
jgi:hypothetical protein